MLCSQTFIHECKYFLNDSNTIIMMRMGSTDDVSDQEEKDLFAYLPV
jgi:hypothetical protein